MVQHFFRLFKAQLPNPDVAVTGGWIKPFQWVCILKCNHLRVALYGYKAVTRYEAVRTDVAHNVSFPEVVLHVSRPALAGSKKEEVFFVIFEKPLNVRPLVTLTNVVLRVPL